MDQGNQATTTVPAPSQPKSKLTIIISGTVLAVLAAAILFQVLRERPSNPGLAAEDGAAGRASVGQERYLARVNGELVTWDEVAQECVDRHGKDVLENVINRKIIQQACTQQNITVTEAEVNQEVLRISKRFGLDIDGWYNLLLTERGLSRVQYQRDVIWPILALKKLANEKIVISDQDLKKAYQNNYGEMVKARMIMMDHPRRIVELWEKIRKNPDDFERFAREYSIEPNSAALGGAIPPIRRYSGDVNLSNAAFKLKPGEFSGIIQLGDGLNRYVILKCEGRTKPVTHDLKSVQADLHATLSEEKIQSAVARVFDKLKKQSQIDNYITKTASRPVKQISANDANAFRTAFPQAAEASANK